MNGAYRNQGTFFFIPCSLHSYADNEYSQANDKQWNRLCLEPCSLCFFFFLLVFSFKKQLDCYGNAKLNVSKPRDDTIPYPDNQAPFHVPAQNPFASASDPDSWNTLQDHCVYSLAVLLLLFVGEKYCRPPYAQTVKVDEVYAAVARGEDCAYVFGMNNPEGRSSCERQKAREIVLSIFDFQQKHNECLLSKMDFFKSKVTEVVSRYETTHQIESAL